MKKLVSVVIAFVLIACQAAQILAVENQISNKQIEYKNYYDSNASLPNAKKTISINGGDFTNSPTDNIIKLDEFEGQDNVVKWTQTKQQTAVNWQFEIKDSAKYVISIHYYALENKNNDIKFGLRIDDEYPFRACESLNFSKIWKNDTNEFKKDSNGNEIRPRSKQVMTWQEGFVNDSEGVSNDPYSFDLFEGNHKLEFLSVSTDVIIDSITIMPMTVPKNYNEVINSSDSNESVVKPTKSIFLQGEKADYKSHPSIVPMYDRSNPATSQAHPTKITYNTIGSYNWQSQNQWLSWKFNVDESGYYNIGMRVRQNYQRGYSTTRRVYIDGEVPFKELSGLEFEYDDKWYIKVLGDDEPFRIYLEKGLHDISIQIVPGNTAQLAQALKTSVFELNKLYRRMIMVTGTTPDLYRDYYLEKEIPTLLSDLKTQKDLLQNEYDRLQAMYGGRDSDTAVMERLIIQLGSFIKDTETIPTRVKSFNDNISALSSWMVKLKDQPLELDYIEIVPEGNEFQKANAGFFENIWFGLQQFFGSFFVDYNSIGDVSQNKESLDVWIGLGRDQVQIIKEMVDDYFSSQNDIPVNIKLAKDSMIQATYAGRGPDVALFIGQDQPVNLAVRNALVDMSKFDDCEDVIKRFSKESVVPYKYNNGLFALPVTGGFNMMFYRQDIFEELNLQPPKTWEDLYNIIPILQRSNMNVGLPKVALDGTGLSPSATAIFDTLLLQKGQVYFNEDQSKTNFDSIEALDAFKEWTGYYTKYSLPLEFDFYNRFRTGEMPIGIEGYAMYNKLAVGAPEIAGLWRMMPVPGTKKEDGTIDRSTSTSGTSAIIFDNGCNKNDAWKFVKWFTEAQTQALYGQSIEALLGPSARYDTANLEALQMLPWSSTEQSMLMEQWRNVKGIPQVPATYYISRNIYNAFRKVTLTNANARETLYKYNSEINAEIERKRIEFGLDK